MKKLSIKEQAWLARMRAEESATGADLSGISDEELANSSMFAYYRLGCATEEIKAVFREQVFEPMADRMVAFVRAVARR